MVEKNGNRFFPGTLGNVEKHIKIKTSAILHTAIDPVFPADGKSLESIFLFRKQLQFHFIRRRGHFPVHAIFESLQKFSAFFLPLLKGIRNRRQCITSYFAFIFVHPPEGFFRPEIDALFPGKTKPVIFRFPDCVPQLFPFTVHNFH